MRDDTAPTAPPVRIMDAKLLAQTPVHVESNKKSDDRTSLGSNSPTPIVHGHTHWTLPRHTPCVCFGWDWTFEPGIQRLLAQWGSMRTNLRVVDANGTDLGTQYTVVCIARLMTRANWEAVVLAQLNQPSG